MKKLIILILINFAVVVSAFAQFSADADGSLNVSELNGNITYTYPISNTTVDGFPMKVDVNYVGNVLFTAFDFYKQKNTESNGNHSDWVAKTCSQPAWIMGVNGFAINVFGYKSRSFSYNMLEGSGENFGDIGGGLGSSYHVSHSPNNYYINDNMINWLIDGYDYCNSMQAPDKIRYQDEIKLLRSDGSVLTLQNTNVDPGNTYNFNDTNHYVGYYYDPAYNSNIFGVVSYDTTKNWPYYIRSKYKGFMGQNDGNILRKPRILKLYLGDGLEYVFREFVAPYGMREERAKQINNVQGQSGSFFPKATIFYLEQINSSMGKVTDFTRLWHNFPDKQNGEVYRGRSPITQFANHEIVFNEGSIDIKVFNEYTIHLDLKQKPIGRFYNFDKQDIYFSTWDAKENPQLVKDTYQKIFNDEVPYMPYPMYNPLPVMENMRAYNDDPVPSYDSYFKLENNMTKENEVPYPCYYDNLSMSQTMGNNILYVNQITDPKGRKTKFEYSNEIYHLHNESDPFYHDMVFQRFKINKITEPTKIIELSYAGSSQQNNTFNPPDYAYQLTYDSVFYNVVNNFKIKDLSNNLLKEWSYDFSQAPDTTWDGPISYLKTNRIVYHDYTTDKIFKKTIDYYSYWYGNVFMTQYYESDGTANYYGLPYIYPLSIRTIADQDTITEITDMDFTIPHNLVPLYKVTYRGKHYLPQNIITYQNFSYVFEHVNNFQFDNMFENQTEANTARTYLGMGLKSVTVNNYQPNDLKKKLSSITTTYLNLTPKFDVDISRNESVMDYSQTFKRRIVYDAFGIGIESIDYLTEQVNESPHFCLPPIWGLPQKQIVYNAEGKVVGGFVKNYDTSNRVEANAPNRRGALVSDSIISSEDAKGNIKTQFNQAYTYSGGQYRNFLGKTQNINGSYSQIYYEYYKIPQAHTDSLATIMYNDESQGTYQFRNLYPEFEKPVANEFLVRKGSANIDAGTGYPVYSVSNTFLNTVYENSAFGMTSGVKDYNGWLWKSTFDENGRQLKTWFPYDFPINFSPRKVLKNECQPITKFETIIARCDQVVRPDYTARVAHVNLNDRIVQDVAFIGKPIVTEPKFTGIINPLDTIKNYEMKSVLYYQPTPNDKFHDNTNITTAKLTLHLEGSVAHFCKVISLKIPSISYQKEILISCPQADYISSGCNPTSSDPAPMEVSFDLSPVVNYFESTLPGNDVALELKMESGDGYVFVDHTTADSYPCIMITSNDITEGNDFTYSFSYDDLNRKTDVIRKVDDKVIDTYEPSGYKYSHSYNNPAEWSQPIPGFDGRYFKNVGHFGADNVLLSTESIIGNFSYPTRTDVMSRDYSGLDVVDQLGYHFRTELDNWGRISKSKMPNNAAVNYSYDYGRPSKYLLDDNAYFGLCYRNTVTAFSGVKTVTYSDAYSRVRMTVIDSSYTGGAKNITTKYDYDNMGRLITITHPDNSQTTFTYDRWGRVLHRSDRDAGVNSFGYDSIGQVRTSQTPVQRESNLLTFLEYDDLGRQTLVGEAKFNNVSGLNLDGTNRTLTDVIDGGKLNVGFAFIPTVNPTIWTPLPSQDDHKVNSILDMITSDQSFIDYIMLSNQIYSTGTNISGADQSSLNALSPPFLVHKANYYPVVSMTTAATVQDFENVYNYPQFARTIVQYDNMPASVGRIWSNFPSSSKWADIMPKHAIRNQKGQKSAIAYRDDATQPFHYVVFSYDARGRIEGMVRYTENLGFDGVYYTYNSLNEPLTITAIDRERQFTTWIDYDDNGRVWKVYSKSETSAPGTELKGYRQVSNGFMMPTPIVKPSSPDMIYFYNQRGAVDSVRYAGGYGNGGFTKSMLYSPNGWVDSLMARTFDRSTTKTIFTQGFTRRADGRIEQQHYQTPVPGPGLTLVNELYTYDRLERMTAFNDGKGNTEGYSYNDMGNINTKTVNGSTIYNYSYDTPNSLPNKLLNITKGTTSERTVFSYNSMGYAGSVQKYNASNILTTKKEMFFDFGGFFVKLKNYDVAHNQGETYGGLGTITKNVDYTDWGYRSNPMGEREQKRIMYSPFGDSTTAAGPNRFHYWSYDLVGAGGEILISYKGAQTALIDPNAGLGSLNTKRRVYMAVEKYYCPAGELQIEANAAKEFFITDALGSVRFVWRAGAVDYKTYKPYGETNTGTTERFGWNENETDAESGFVNMGARLYMPEAGRFLAPDPLADMMPFTTPYQYAFNNPMMYGDPTGLAPEKNEKSRDRQLQDDGLPLTGLPYHKDTPSSNTQTIKDPTAVSEADVEGARTGNTMDPGMVDDWNNSVNGVGAGNTYVFQMSSPITGAPSINGLGSRSSGGGITAARDNDAEFMNHLIHDTHWSTTTSLDFETNLARQNADPMTESIMRYAYYTTTPWMTIAEGETGVKEISGPLGDNSQILKYLRSAGMEGNSLHDEIPWCAAFVSWNMNLSGITGFKSTWARNWLNFGQKIDYPAYGAIAIFGRNGGGHVGFVLGINSDCTRLVILGGNQSDMVNFSSKGTDRILGYVYPLGFIPNYDLPIINSTQFKFIRSNGTEH